MTKYSNMGTDEQIGILGALFLLFAVIVIPSILRIKMPYPLCWLFYTAFTHTFSITNAYGIATTIGITIMIEWYTLRIFDRSAFKALLKGWLGVWSSSSLVKAAARVVDVLIFLGLPMMMISCYISLVRVWMSIPTLIAVHFWRFIVVGGELAHPKSDDVYRFSPPRSQHFWTAAHKIELLLNIVVPLFCVLVHQRSYWIYMTTASFGILLLLFHLVRTLTLPRLRWNAEKIMSRLLLRGGIRPAEDFIVRDDSIWLDWMADGLISIGESYVGGLWALNVDKNIGENARSGGLQLHQLTLDEIVASLMSIPMDARQEMYRDWSARFVALFARVFQYPSSSSALVVGAVSDQFNDCTNFRREYMDRYLHHSFALWHREGRDLDFEDAYDEKLKSMVKKLDLKSNYSVLDICIRSWGGVGCYLAKNAQDEMDKPLHISVTSVVPSAQACAYAREFAASENTQNAINFLIAESPEQLLNTLSNMAIKKYDRIVCAGLLEALTQVQLVQFLLLLKRVLRPQGRCLFELIASGTSSGKTLAWSNKYVNQMFPCYPVTLDDIVYQLRQLGFTLLEVDTYTSEYERSCLEWHRRFQSRWSQDLQDGFESHNGKTRSLPESFKRTWEFYLLHSAACFRVRTLQAYQILVV